MLRIKQTKKERNLSMVKLLLVFSLIYTMLIPVKATENKELLLPVMSITFDNKNADDSSGNDNHGTVVGDVEYVEGIKGKAIHIQNGDVANTQNTAIQYVNFGQPTDLQFSTNDFSIAFWYKGNATELSSGAIVSNKNWSWGGNVGFVIADFNNTFNLNFTPTDVSRADVEGFSTVSDNLWHHVTAVFDRSDKMYLYIDGEEIASKDISFQLGKSIDAFEFILGADGLKQYGIEDAYIDELEVFKGVLSQSDIINSHGVEILEQRIIKFNNKIDKYEEEVSNSNVSQEKKDTFINIINKVKVKLETVVNLEELEQLDQKLQKAYSDFGAPDKGISEFVILSDTHVGASATSSSAVNLNNALQDIKTYSPDVNLVLNGGDVSSDGGESEFNQYYSILDKYNNDLTFMNALGNHDVRWTSQGWDYVYEKYMRYNSKYMGETDKVYHDKWVDGYHFIVLNTEWDLKDRAYISNEQLEWFDKTIAEGAKDGKPIFVVLHQPLRETYWNSTEWDAGMQDYALKEILRKYPQTILFSGHLHNGLGKSEIIETDYGTVVDVPGFLRNDAGDSRGQLGYYVTVYEDKVQLSMRDFANDEWLSSYHYTVDLKADKPAVKVLDVNFDNENANDVSGYNNHGTVVGDIEFTEGVKGKAAHIVNDKNIFNATQYIDFGVNKENLQFGQDDFSIMFWYKGSKELVTEGSIISNKDWNSASNQGFVLGNFTDPRPGFGLNFTAAGSSRKDTGRSSKVIDGKWHHVAATFDRDGSMSLYVDGKVMASTDISADFGKTIDVEDLHLILGADGKAQYPVRDSYIDELKIYRSVLTGPEIETVVTPFNVEVTETEATFTWDELDSQIEPAYLLLNGERYNVESGQKNKVITGLKENTEYLATVVTREKSIKGNLKDAFDIEFKTKKKEAVVNKTKLADKIKEVEKLSKADYTELSWNELEAVLKEARELLTNNEATQALVDEMVTKLQTAIDNLVPIGNVETDKLALQIAIELADKASLENVVPAVVKEFNEALAHAKTINKKANATQDEVDKAFDRLAKVMHKLEFFKGDKKALKDFIDKVKELKESEYTEGTWKTFQDALSTANKVYEDVNAMQAEVNQTYTELVKAFVNLRYKPNKDLLKDLVTKADGLVAANYSEASWSRVANALEKARAVLDNPEATVEEVNNANNALTKAISGLESKPVNLGDSHNGKESAVKTGDEIVMLYPLASLVIASVILYSNKKYNN